MDNSKNFLVEFERILNNNPGIKVLSFDFGNVQFMDSSGIGSLIRAASIAKSNCHEIVVFNLNKSLYSVFKLSGIHNMMSLLTKSEFNDKYPNISDA